MISIASKAKVIEKFTVDNSPAILTALGVIGVVGTAVLAAKGHLSAEDKLAQDTYERLKRDEPPADRKEQIKMVWTCYAPPIVVGGLTIGSIVFANRVGSKRAAAIAAAYTISERAFADYKEKVVEHIGPNKEQKIRDEVAQDWVRKNPQSESNVIIVGDGDVMCCDLWSGRYFRSSVEAIKKARNETNQEIIHSGYASLTDFYDRIGLPRTQESDEVGWNQDELLEIDFTAVVNEEGHPCVAYRFPVHPVRGYYKLHP